MTEWDRKEEKLAETVVGDWDMDTLLSYAIESMTIFYIENQEEFKEDWDREHDIST